MSIMAIIGHLSTIMSLIQNIEGLVGEVAQKKSLKDCVHIDATLADIEKLFDDEVLKIPNVDDKAIAAAIQAIRDQLKCLVP